MNCCGLHQSVWSAYQLGTSHVGSKPFQKCQEWLHTFGLYWTSAPLYTFYLLSPSSSPGVHLSVMWQCILCGVWSLHPWLTALLPLLYSQSEWHLSLGDRNILHLGCIVMQIVTFYKLSAQMWWIWCTPVRFKDFKNLNKVFAPGSTVLMLSLLIWSRTQQCFWCRAEASFYFWNCTWAATHYFVRVINVYCF